MPDGDAAMTALLAVAGAGICVPCAGAISGTRGASQKSCDLGMFVANDVVQVEEPLIGSRQLLDCACEVKPVDHA